MQARSNCLWALAVLQGLHLPAFPVLVKAMISRNADWLDLEPVQRHQLFQVGHTSAPSHRLSLRIHMRRRCGGIASGTAADPSHPLQTRSIRYTRCEALSGP